MIAVMLTAKATQRRREARISVGSRVTAMMGERAVRQEALFYGFNLDDHVPADQLLRSIDRFRRVERHSTPARALLQHHWPAFDRP